MVDLPGDAGGAARLNIYQTSDCNFIVPCISCRYFYKSFVANICKKIFVLLQKFCCKYLQDNFCFVTKVLLQIFAKL